MGRFRAAVSARNRVLRDPRFEASAGRFDESRFRENFAFLGEYKDSELAELRRAVRDEAEPGRRAEVAALLAKQAQQRREELERDALRAARRARKRDEAAAVAAGKKPFFLKRADLKRVEATERFRLLEARGGAAVDHALKRRRK